MRAVIGATAHVELLNQAALLPGGGLDRAEETDPVPITVVMADTRSLGTDVPADVGSASSLQLIAAINLQYAKEHNYKFVRFTYAEDHCMANLKSQPVTRHPSWCKLLAIQHVAKQSPGHGFVLWLDSDAVVSDHTRDFASFLQTAGFEDGGGKKVDPVEAARLKKEAAFFAFRNDPWGPLPCAGVQAWRLPLPAKFLAQWWATETKPDWHDNWEQTALWKIYPTWKQSIGIFDVTAFPNKKCEFSSESQYIRHLTHAACDQKTILALISNSAPTAFSSLLQELKGKYSAVLSKDDMEIAAKALEAK